MSAKISCAYTTRSACRERIANDRITDRPIAHENIPERAGPLAEIQRRRCHRHRYSTRRADAVEVGPGTELLARNRTRRRSRSPASLYLARTVHLGRPPGPPAT